MVYSERSFYQRWYRRWSRCWMTRSRIKSEWLNHPWFSVLSLVSVSCADRILAELKVVYSFDSNLSFYISSYNLSLKIDFVSLSVLIFSQSILLDSCCSLLNFIDVNLNFVTIAVWSLLNPIFLTLQTLILLNNWSQHTKLSNMCANFLSLNDLYVI